MSLSAALHRPHGKQYCVNFQAEHGTLKGIENTWDEVTEGCCAWENQQHGRGHHLKVVLKNVKAGQAFRLKLLQEDGEPAPAFTITKQATKKSTMLVGIDSRDWRMGLSWKEVNQEGPRRWFPACSFVIKSLSSLIESVCEVEGEEKFVLLVPPGDNVIIPIRVEVLSAVKGAGNFSRYSVSLSEEVSGWMWDSPPILVEAKWLPAAPVRVQNKSRLSGDEKKEEKTAADADRFNESCAFVAKYLEDPNIYTNNTPGGLHVDLSVQKLLCTLARYQLNRSTFSMSKDLGNMKRPQGNKRRQHEILSSPPKGPRSAPVIPPQLMQAIALPPSMHQQHHASFSKFEMLAQAASSSYKTVI